MIWRVTYSIVTPESAEAGDVAEIGVLGDHESLRDAVDEWRETRMAHCDVVQCVEWRETRTAHCDGVQCVESNEWPVIAPRWFDIVNGPEFQTGAQESRSLHIPEAVTPASRCRLARVLGVTL